MEIKQITGTDKYLYALSTDNRLYRLEYDMNGQRWMEIRVKKED